MNRIYLFFILIPSFLLCQKEPYAVSNIADSLMNDADAVIRNHKVEFDIKSPGRAVEKNHLVITVLKKKAIKYAAFAEYYSDLSKIRNIKATLYDENGNKIRNIDNKASRDYSAIDENTLFSDSRVVTFDPEMEQVPFTISISYVKKYDGLLYYPHWYPVMNFDIGLEKASLEVSIHKDQKLRYTMQNHDFAFGISQEGNRKVYSWSLTNICPVEHEPFSLPYKEIVPAVITAPEQFEIEGYSGNQKSWRSFGKWLYKLQSESQNLPPLRKADFITMTKDLDSDSAKISKLYNYLQSNTRYLNLKIGIGGWKPISAQVTDEKGIGDCKSLTNYMQAMLDVVGIESWYTVIMAGENPPKVNLDFPSSQFNHVILTIPQPNDTIWLECTSQYSPMNYWSKFTDNRYALAVKPDGGHIIKTPGYKAEDNRRIKRVNINLRENGGGEVKLENTYKGTYYEEEAFLSYVSDEEKKKKYLYKRINFPDFKVTDFTHSIDSSKVPAVHENVNLSINNYATKMGELLFIPLNTVSKVEQVPEKVDNRINDLFLRRSFIHNDTVKISLPSGYEIKQLPEYEEYECSCAAYSSKTVFINNKILYVRELKLKEGQYAPDEYAKFRSFLLKVSEADNLKVVAKKI
ncbi:DUF3857 domain-containing protein [Salinivirga cyanobacteriivorans]